MNNQITKLFSGRRQPLFNMFGKRRNNRGKMWVSLLGLGVSAAAFGLRRNRNMNTMQSLQNIMNHFRMRKTAQTPNMAGLTEFSKELAPNKNPLAKNK